MIKNTTQVVHGSPGYETKEVITSIKAEGINMITINFESGFFTKLSKEDFDTFIDSAKVTYYRKFPDGKALENLELLSE